MRWKIKWMDFASPFQMTPIVTWMIRKLQILLSWVSGQWDHRAEPGIQSRLLPHGLCPFALVLLQYDEMEYIVWEIDEKYPIFPPSIRNSNVALMLWYGEKSDLALGSGMFLVRLWWGGPGRGYMKGSLCQAAKMFSLSLMKTRTHRQTWEHACHTLYEHYSYNTVDKCSILLLFSKGWQSENHDKRMCVVRLK